MFVKEIKIVELKMHELILMENIWLRFFGQVAILERNWGRGYERIFLVGVSRVLWGCNWLECGLVLES
jgi:predicted TIM-barrel fold metal-dependent hydrolase